MRINLVSNYVLGIYYAARYLSHLAPAKLFIVPFSQDEHFVGREDILNQLDFGGQQETPRKHRRHAIVGLGGVG